MIKCKPLVLFYCILLLVLPFTLFAQRVYTTNSVLSKGNWYKIAVKTAGVYKIDAAFFNSLGITNGTAVSSNIKIYGNGGSMLPENNAEAITDDLQEIAIDVIDGGDGKFDGTDYLLFYAQGPDAWLKDSVNRSFLYQKNLYTNQSYYFITVDGVAGKRIVNSSPPAITNTNINSFLERYHYELDSVNFLSSGKEWYGEEFATLPGRKTSQTFNLPYNNFIAGQSATIVSECIARSLSGACNFLVNINGNNVLQQNIPQVSNSNLDLFARTNKQQAIFTASNTISVNYNFQPGNGNAQGWLNWFDVLAYRPLAFVDGKQILFRDWRSVGAGSKGQFVVQNANSTTKIWDVTDMANPINMVGNLNGSDFVFKNDNNSLHEYAVFNTDFLTPIKVERLANQNLHNSSYADMIIITHESLFAEAQRLANYHKQKDGFITVVVTVSQVYNEFSSGSADISAIRNFVKMYYDKAGNDSTKRPKYLLLLGDASFDYKNRLSNNTNLVPAYENNLSLDPLATYTSDDFFALLDDNDDINSANFQTLLDIGVGRIPAADISQAKAYVDKVIAYQSKQTLGSWRNETLFTADDEDLNIHLNDAEIITTDATKTNPIFQINKIYLDAFQQQSNAAGSTYPDVNTTLNNLVQSGVLIYNYNGHGGYRRLAEETILDDNILSNWKNENRLPLFITATCDFAPYDNPTINSLGETLLLKPNTGGIALMTTTRLVFAFSNRLMNNNYLQVALAKQPNGNYLRLGDAVKNAKNTTYSTSTDIINNRKFTLLGDPALRLAFAENNIVITTINGKDVLQNTDTLKALNKYMVSGELKDANAQLLNNFNGTLTATVYDKPLNITTRANDAGSLPQTFKSLQSSLFKGKATVQNGKFNIEFLVPKDIDYTIGAGTMRFYADNGSIDASGLFNKYFVGGSQGISNDVTGPTIKAYLNDEKFVNGSLVNSNPNLIVVLKDSSGINIAKSGIGHDITAMLDNDPSQVFILNNFFEADIDSYQKGVARFQLPFIKEGKHILTIKSWDAANNSGEVVLDFIVAESNRLVLQRVLNYPNPFTTHTNFWFEHNRPFEDLFCTVQIFTITGKLVKTITQTINTAGNRSTELDWDGKDDYGDKLAKGVYLYILKVKSASGEQDKKIEKIYLM